MAATKTKSRSANSSTTPAASADLVGGEVMTLAEAATYLRISEQNVLRMVHDEGLPGRKIGEDWRFLKRALQDWLRTPPHASKEAMLALAGAWKDDPGLEEIVREAYRQRGRPITEEEK